MHETVEAALGEVPPPQPNHRQRHACLRRDLRVRHALRGPQHDPRTQCLLLGSRRRSRHRTQHRLVLAQSSIVAARAATATVLQLHNQWCYLQNAALVISKERVPHCPQSASDAAGESRTGVDRHRHAKYLGVGCPGRSRVLLMTVSCTNEKVV